MKNSFKIAALALVISASITACGGNNTTGVDSVKTDSVKIDSVKTDSTKVVDTVKKSTELLKNKFSTFYS